MQYFKQGLGHLNGTRLLHSHGKKTLLLRAVRTPSFQIGYQYFKIEFLIDNFYIILNCFCEKHWIAFAYKTCVDFFELLFLFS